MKPFLTVYSTLLASPSTLFSHNISYAVSVMIKRFGNIRLICSEEAGAIYTCYCHTHCNNASELTQPIHYFFHFFSFLLIFENGRPKGKPNSSLKFSCQARNDCKYNQCPFRKIVNCYKS